MTPGPNGLKPQTTLPPEPPFLPHPAKPPPLPPHPQHLPAPYTPKPPFPPFLNHSPCPRADSGNGVDPCNPRASAADELTRLRVIWHQTTFPRPTPLSNNRSVHAAVYLGCRGASGEHWLRIISFYNIADGDSGFIETHRKKVHGPKSWRMRLRAATSPF